MIILTTTSHIYYMNWQQDTYVMLMYVLLETLKDNNYNIVIKKIKITLSE